MIGHLKSTEGAAHIDVYNLKSWANYKTSTEDCRLLIEANNKITFDSTEEFVHWANSLGYRRPGDDNGELAAEDPYDFGGME